MKIVFDGTTLTPLKTGVGYYTQHLLEHLVETFPADDWVVISNQNIVLPRQVERRVRVDRRWSLPSRMAWLQLQANRHLVRLEPDIAHFTNSISPPRSAVPTVLTIHDMSLDLYPRLHPLRRRLTRQFVHRSASCASAIIVPSESCRRDLCRILRVPRERVFVVREAAAPRFSPVPNEEAGSEIRERYQLPGRYILHVGTIEPRKNLVNLVRAFSNVHTIHPDVSLVLAGPAGWGLRQVRGEIARLAVEDSVKLTGYVPFSDLPALYGLAEATIYPSLHEGFGLPVLESMACGSPVITSAHSSLVEVTGDAALLLEGTDAPSLSRAMLNLLADSALREELSARCIAHAGMFSWQQAAQETHDIYDRVVRQG